MTINSVFRFSVGGAQAVSKTPLVHLCDTLKLPLYDKYLQINRTITPRFSFSVRIVLFRLKK